MNLTALPLADRAEYLADRDMGTTVLFAVEDMLNLGHGWACPNCGEAWNEHDWIEVADASGEVIGCDLAIEVVVAAGTAAVAVDVVLAA